MNSKKSKINNSIGSTQFNNVEKKSAVLSVVTGLMVGLVLAAIEALKEVFIFVFEHLSITNASLCSNFSIIVTCIIAIPVCIYLIKKGKIKL